MAYYTTERPAFGLNGNAFARFFARIGNAMVRISEANGRMRRVAALNAMSDEALAARGLRREDIVRHVFGDVYWM